jgi:hypothetical protein
MTGVRPPTGDGESQVPVARETRQKTTDKETTLPPISEPPGPQGGGRRFSLNRVENGGQIGRVPKTVGATFFGQAVIPTIHESLAILEGTTLAAIVSNTNRTP